jgi:hypothetical protein
MKSAAGRQSVGKPADLIRFVCRCGRALKAPVRLAGSGCRCPACGADVVVPERACNHRIVFASLPDDSAPTDAELSRGQPAADGRPDRGARLNETAMLSMSPTVTDIDVPADDPNTYTLCEQPPAVFKPTVMVEAVPGYDPPAPFERSPVEGWCDPLVGVKFLFYLSGLLALMTTMGVGLIPHVLHEGFAWTNGLFLTLAWGAAMAFVIGYGCAFLDSVTAYAIKGGKTSIEVPDLDPRPALTSISRWALCFAAGPAFLVYFAFRHWLYCGDVKVIDALILVELTMPAIGYWMIAMLVLAGRPDLSRVSPAQVFKAICQLGLRGLLAIVAATILAFVHLCVAAGAVMLLHRSWLAGLVILWFCWFSAWQCSTYALWTLGSWYHRCRATRRASGNAA